MSQSDQSVWAYHCTHFKADALIIAGAVSGLGLIAWAAATLHGFASPLSHLALSCTGAGLLLSVVTIASRELLRRRGLAKGQPLASRFPKLAFAATFLGSLFLTAGLTRTHLESGVAVYQGRQFLEAGQYQAAAESFQRVIELAPNQAKGYCLRGLALYRAGETQAAYDDLQTALTLQPGDKSVETIFMATVGSMENDLDPGAQDELAN